MMDTTQTNDSNALNTLDYISRQDAVSAISDLLMLELNGKRLPTWNEVYRAINAVPSAQPEQRWIPVTKGMPQRCTCVWVTDFGEAEIGFYSSDGWWFDIMGNKLKDVTAWMPLPEPYREETEDED